MWMAPSRSPSLDRSVHLRRINAFAVPDSSITDVTVHRFEQIIDGRTYHIDVTRVSDRWRAQLRRTQGMPTALMPFYGQTPDEAAQQLTKWLLLAHRRHAQHAVAASTDLTVISRA